MTIDPLSTAPIHRVAVYFSPTPESLWWQAGRQWLGRCADSGQALPLPEVKGVTPEQFARLTAAPRRYGWHATLKAPFAMGADVNLEGVRQAVQAIAARHRRFVLPPLQVRMLGDFIALVPAPDDAGLHRLADALVTGLQPLAAPLSDAELARRRATGLSAEQDQMLQRWGYPHVLAHFRFHISLTGSLKGHPPEVVTALLTAARQRFEPLPLCAFDSVALFAEGTPGANMLCLNRVDLAE
jgi:hypothetical protein